MGYRGFIEHDGNHAPKPPFQLNKDSSQAQGLMGWWPLNVAGGTIARDMSVYGDAHGTFTGGLASSDRVVKRLNHFGINTDGVTDRVEVSSPPGRFFTEINSISGWFIPTSVATFSRPFTSSLAGADWPWEFRLTGSKWAAFCFDGSTWQQALSLAAASNGVLYHLVGTRTATATSLYVNGVFQTSDSASIASTIDSAASITFSGNSGTGSQGFAGHMFDLRVYNRTLSAAEAWELYAPQTRWDLYRQPNRVNYFVPAVVAGGGLPAGSLASMGVGI